MSHTEHVDNRGPLGLLPGWAAGLADSVGLEGVDPSKMLRIKMGFDPTAPDLHLGHAVGLLALRRMQDMGHRVSLVVGDFTAAIGDPTGRDASRPSLGHAEIKSNAATYAAQAMRILDPDKTEVHYNSMWLNLLGAAGMVELAAKATVSQMLARDDFSKRFGQGAPIGAHELLYPLLQAQDSVELVADIEFGGSDQRFNLLMGRELMRRAGQKPQACAMVPLLVGLDGERKMSKSLGNHIGLNESASAVFAKTMSISDDTMRAWIQTLRAPITENGCGPMEAKKLLGCWIAGVLGDPDVGARARAVWESSRQGGDWSEVAMPLRATVPLAGVPWARAIRDWGWEPSAQQARKRIEQGALRVDGEKVLGIEARLMPGLQALVRYGSKRAAQVTSIAEIHHDSTAVVQENGKKEIENAERTGSSLPYSKVGKP